jgi:hypothetical protein
LKTITVVDLRKELETPPPRSHLKSVLRIPKHVSFI